MNANGISNAGANLSELLAYLSQQNAANTDTSSSTTSSDTTSLLGAATTPKNAGSAYSSGMSSSTGQAALNKVISELSGKIEGKLTFAKIAEYKETLEQQFSAQVKADLKKLGVSENVEFTITMQSDGTIGVDSEDKVAKSKILDYLKNNPEVSNQFGYIQALGNFDRSTQTTAGAAWSEVYKANADLTAQAVSTFFDQSLSSGSFDYSALTATFTNSLDTSSVSFFSGINYTV